jgi:hypothetical protein
MKKTLFAFALLPLWANCLPSNNMGTGTGGSPGTGGESVGTGGSSVGLGGSTGTGGGQVGTDAGSGTGGRNGGTGGVAVDAGGGLGGAGTGGASGNPVCDSVRQFLDGFAYMLPCGANQSYSVLVCVNPAGACAGGSEYLVQGTHNTDMKFTVAGTAAQSCTLTLTVQGVVEPKHYSAGTNRCTTYFGSPQEGFAQGPAAGGVNSGCYPATSGNYNVYMMHVSDSPTALTGTAVTGMRYFWNAINQNEAHFSYPINYTTPPITIKGGQTLWMLADDSNCSAIKNCATTSVDNAASPPGRCDGITVPNIVPPVGKTIAQPYNGQFVLLHVATAQ